MAADVFIQISLMIVLATAGAFVARMLRQPLIPAYILVGILIGPVWKLVTSSEFIKSMSLIGIAFLLFIVGLELSLKKIRDLGTIIFIGSTIQVLLVFALGFAAAIMLGFYRVEAAYLGLILTFSSTMMVIKLLSDKKQLESLHGKIIIGILLMQDVLAILALSILSSLDSPGIVMFGFSLLKAGSVFLLAFLCSKFIFPRLFRFGARSSELLFMMSVSVCFFFSVLIYYFNISIAIGAFIAGLSLANLPYNLDIISKVKSLKDFFATLFFVSLGMSVVLGEIRKVFIPLLVFTLVVIVLKPLLIMFITSIFGYTKKVSFFTGVSLAQVSEFSIMIASSGLVLGHLSNELFTLTIVLAIATMIGTSYFIQFSERLFRFSSRFLGIFDYLGGIRHLDFMPHKDVAYDAILIGYDRIGYSIFRTFQKMKYSFLVVDYNPDIIRRLVAKKVPCLYGDVGDDTILDRISLQKAKLIISTIPSYEDTMLVIEKTRAETHKALIVVTANAIKEALSLYAAGADYVILPHFLGGERASEIIEKYHHDIRRIITLKHEHLDHLKERQRLEHEHPAHH